jgi:hypothetical protein
MIHLTIGHGEHKEKVANLVLTETLELHVSALGL